eukprot:6190571-Pleurochrysis_carterae.AAC.4
MSTDKASRTRLRMTGTSSLGRSFSNALIFAAAARCRLCLACSVTSALPADARGARRDAVESDASALGCCRINLICRRAKFRWVLARRNALRRLAGLICEGDEALLCCCAAELSPPSSSAGAELRVWTLRSAAAVCSVLWSSAKPPDVLDKRRLLRLARSTRGASAALGRPHPLRTPPRVMMISHYPPPECTAGYTLKELRKQAPPHQSFGMTPASGRNSPLAPAAARLRAR